MSVTKNRVIWTTAGVTTEITGVTKANCDCSTATAFPADGINTSCSSCSAANGRSST